MFVTHTDCTKRPEDVFAHYIIERETIRYYKDVLKKAPPFTDDPILEVWKFCNIFRDDDAVTKHYLAWMKERTEVYKKTKSDNAALEIGLDTLMYRTINWPPTINAVGHNEYPFHRTRAKEIIKIERDMASKGAKTFTSAYLIAQCGRRAPKIHVVVDSMAELHVGRENFARALKANSLEEMWKFFRHQISICGPFTAYEVVTDLSYNILSNATDKMTWANAGPGALRGINRLRGLDKRRKMKPNEALEEMQLVMQLMIEHFECAASYCEDTQLGKHFKKCTKRVNMRTAEHTLCEYDKYCRVATGDGFPRSKYHPAREPFHVK